MVAAGLRRTAPSVQGSRVSAIESPGAAGTARVIGRVVRLIALSNVVGIAVVVVASTLATPAASATLQRVGVFAAVTAIYVAVAVPHGTVQALRRARRGLRPLYESRPPSPAELRVMLSMSARQMAWVGAYWLGAALVIGVSAAALGTEPLVSLRSTVVILLGGLTTCTLGFILAERITRPLAIASLSYGVEAQRPRLSGVRARLVGAWAIGSGLPLLAIALALAGGTELDRGRLVALGIVLALSGLFAGGGMLLLTSASIAEPLDELRAALQRVRDGDLDARVAVSDAAELGDVQRGFNLMVDGLRERERLRDLFGRHVGIDVARHALQQSDPGGEVRTVSVLFVDVVGSTALAESRPAPDVVAMLNAMFDAVVRITDAEGGLVNKFEGDAALCVFGAPIGLDDHATHACRAARTLRAQLHAVQRRYPGLDAAIGVSCGRVVAGNVGGEARYEYTVIGDAVNEAARLTTEAKADSCRVLASGDAVAQCDAGERARWVRRDVRTLRGRTRPTEVYAPAG
jgi:adenylate cyclase